MDEHEGSESFEGSVRSYSHVWIKSQRYGAATAHRGKSARYAYIDIRKPVEIQYIFRAELSRVHGPSLLANFVLIREFQRGEDLPRFPWELWCVPIFFAEDIKLTLVSGCLILGSRRLR